MKGAARSSRRSSARSSAPTGSRSGSLEHGRRRFRGFPFGGDPEDLLRGLREFAEQQAESVQEAQREQFATLTLNTAVELTAAALKQVQPSGAIDEQAIALRDAMRVLFPEAVALVSGCTPGVHARASHARALGSPAAVSLLDRAVVTLLPAVPKRGRAALSSRYIAGPTLDDALARRRRLNAEGKLATVDVLGEEVADAPRGRGDRGRVPRRARRLRAPTTSTRTSASSRPGSA